MYHKCLILIHTLSSADMEASQDKVEAALSSPATPSKDDESKAEVNVKRSLTSEVDSSDAPPAKALKCWVPKPQIVSTNCTCLLKC